MVAKEYSSSYCAAAKRNCSFKHNISKKFRFFFERTLANPLPADLQDFLQKAYSSRSSYVHQALLGEFGLAPYQPFEETGKLYQELGRLSRFVRAGLIQWLIKI
jgi:hypothetical protein